MQLVKRRRGRKEIQIDWNIVDKHLVAHCSGAKIASHMGISYATLSRRCEEQFKVNFEEYSRSKKAEGADMLKLKMFDKAIKGDTTMLIWLGKQYCGQSEKGSLVVENTTNSRPMESLTDEELAILAKVNI